MTRPVEYVPTPFGILLDAHRRIHRLSLRRLARDTGMSDVEVSDILRGKVAHAPRDAWPLLIAAMPTLTLPTLEFAAKASKVEVREPWLPEEKSPASDDPTGFTAAPKRYTAQGRETIDCIRDELGDDGFAAFCRGNAMKYVARAGRKGDYWEDMEKAWWYAWMFLHVKGEAEDPRSGREGFEPYSRPVLRNCWTCRHTDYGDDSNSLCALDPLADPRNQPVCQWLLSHDLDANDMPSRDADGCPGWAPKGGAA